MMIPVRPAQADQPLAEWALIELQGKVESLVGAAVTDIGVLLQGKDADSMTLTVGYHQLDAKRVALKKPFLLISKVSGAASVEYQVDGVVRSKWLFKQRPRALISKPDA